MDHRSPLEIEIRRRISAAGPMPVGEYMTLCLTDRDHGYYTTRDPFGAGGDFTTAPEVSQMFGELIGLWMATVWKQMGSPENVRVVELGPGRGTMLQDALRAAQIVPAFRAAIVLHLVEISPALRAQQEQSLEGLGTPVEWHASIGEVPRGPAIIVANEFFDALPIQQAVKTGGGWHERRIAVDAAGALTFTVARDPIPQFEQLLPASVRTAAEGSIFEWRSDSIGMEIGRRIDGDTGAALVIDYGHGESAAGETLQAVGRHAFADPLRIPGEVDLTAHVDFQALARAIEAMGANSFGPVPQAQFLRALGIQHRASALKAQASRADEADVELALVRLTGESRTGMGRLFKAMGFAHPKLGMLPGFA